jgi:excisionase family DNA binding protein
MTTTPADGAATQWLRLSAAADVLGVSGCTLRRWSDAGKVPCHRTAGGQRRYRRADLQRLLAAPPTAALVEQGAAAIHTQLLLNRLEERNRVLNALLDEGKATTSTLQLDEVLRILARESAHALSSPSCLIWEYLADIDSIVERECYDVLDEYVIRSEVEPLSKRPEQGLVLFADSPVIETLADPDLDPASRASMEQWGEKTCLSVPIVFGDERLGVLVFSETEAERTYSAAELDLATGLADRAAVAIHNARL